MAINHAIHRSVYVSAQNAHVATQINFRLLINLFVNNTLVRNRTCTPNDIRYTIWEWIKYYLQKLKAFSFLNGWKRISSPYLNKISGLWMHRVTKIDFLLKRVADRLDCVAFARLITLTQVCSWPGVSNSDCCVGHMRTHKGHMRTHKGHMRTHKVTRGPHYIADATMSVSEFARNSIYILFPAKGITNYIGKSFLAVSTFAVINCNRLRNLFTR